MQREGKNVDSKLCCIRCTSAWVILTGTNVCFFKSQNCERQQESLRQVNTCYDYEIV